MADSSENSSNCADVHESAEGIRLARSRIRRQNNPSPLLREMMDIASVPSPSSSNDQRDASDKTDASKRPVSRLRTESQRFYTSQQVTNPGSETPEAADGHIEIKRFTTNQSRRLPHWVWFMIAKSVGIKLHQFDKPWFGTLLHVLTLTFAFGYAICNTWYTVYDILSEKTKQTELTGVVVIVIGIYWISLGIYANKLAWRLFSNPKFLDSVRLHTRTVFKISAAGLLIILATTEMVLINFQSLNQFNSAYCEKVALSAVVCKVMYVCRVGYSIFAIFWNLLVGIVLLSVCRTHTIGIRRFIKELERDGRVYERILRHERGLDRDENAEFDTDEEYLWDEDPLVEQELMQSCTTARSPSIGRRSLRLGSQRSSVSGGYSVSPGRRWEPSATTRGLLEEINGRGTDANNPAIVISEDSGINNPSMAGVINAEVVIDTSVQQQEQVAATSRTYSQTSENSLQADGTTTAEAAAAMSESSHSGDTLPPAERGLQMLSIDEILYGYWKIQCRLRATSIALQRWLVAWICFILVWSATFIVWWVSHEATVTGIAEFIIPILVLPLVCSAYGEVNNEGKRMLRCVCLTQERLDMMFFMIQQPLELNAFGFAINYSMIGGALGALALAFCTRIVMDEIHM